MPLPDDFDPIQDAKHARETALTTRPEKRPMTPTEALAAWEAADARKRAAKLEQEAADAAWIDSAEVLAQAIETAAPDAGHGPVMIGGKVVRCVWDDYWTVRVETPAVLS